MPQCPFWSGCLKCFVSLYLMEVASMNKMDLPRKEINEIMKGLALYQTEHYEKTHGTGWKNLQLSEQPFEIKARK